MRGRVAVLFLLSLASTQAFPQCSWSPHTTTPFRSSVLDVAADGNDLWIATSYGVELRDRTVDPPALVASIAVPGTTRVVRPHGGLVYAGSGTKIVVLRKNGRALELIRGVETGGNVNDLLFSGSYLFAATSAGLTHFDLFDPQRPTRTSVSLFTTGTNVTSLASAGATLYAADGDSSVEIFTIGTPALPQHTSELTALPGSNAVNVTANRVYVSDGQSTQVFTGLVKETTLPYGSASFSTLGGETHLVAGRDRALRVVDFSLAAKPVGLFEELLPASGGNVNRIAAIQVAGGRAYVAAGDIGLVTYDLTSFRAPYPLHTTAAAGPMTSTLVMNRVYATGALPAGGIVEYEVAGDGSLNARRSWAAEAKHTLLDANAGLLLTANSTSLLQWDTATATPTNISTADFDFPVRNAVLMHAALAYVLLADETLWRVNFAAGTATTTRIPGAAGSRLARNGNAVAVAEVKTDTGNTDLRYYAAGDPAASPTRAVTIRGAANGTLALGASRAAVTTYLGINVVDLATGAVSTLPDSLVTISPALRIEGSRLLALAPDALSVWDLASGNRIRTFSVAGGAALHTGGGTAAVATSSGIASIAYESNSALPERFDAGNPNRFHTRVVAGAARAYLFSRDGIDIYDTAHGAGPRYMTRIRPVSLLDAAIVGTTLVTLSGNGVVTSWSRDGALLRETQINEGSDAQMLAIVAAGHAAWVAISRGCLSGGCEKKTLVFDPSTLSVTSTLTGGVVDAVTAGTRAYALFRLPNEVRVYNLADPFHPSPVIAAGTPASAVSVAYSASTVHVLGDKLYSFAEATLTAAGDHFAAATPNDAQRVRIDGNCAVVTGRAINPELYALPNWASAASFELPSTVRSAALDGARLFILTDHSLEVWSDLGGQPVKRRAVR